MEYGKENELEVKDALPAIRLGFDLRLVDLYRRRGGRWIGGRRSFGDIGRCGRRAVRLMMASFLLAAVGAAVSHKGSGAAITSNP